MQQQEPGMKHRVARTLKWNVLDKVATQLLYGITGIILARVLSQADFGLVGAIAVFQSFATLFIDSGFSYALLQRKRPSHLDYSTILWFNIIVATLAYIILFLCAPLIAGMFKGDLRLIPLSRVMFLTFILNAAAIVQTNMRMKKMDVRMITISNSTGLIAGAVVGIYLALTGYGAWALVWQAITNSAVKTAILWFSDDWRPAPYISLKSLRSFFRVGSGVLGTSFLNVLFQNIYSFFIGIKAGLVPLGYYSQADKWSKMGVASLSGVFTQSFLPLLSEYQDDPQRYSATTSRINRFASYLVFPSFALLIVIATPVFHALFGEKWDPSIILFQLLLIRGIFTILVTLYHNYVLSLGRSKLMIYSEIIRDGAAIIAIAITLPYIALSTPDDLTRGLTIFLWGQVAASVLAWAVMLVIASRVSWSSPWRYLLDSLPYAAQSLLLALLMFFLRDTMTNPWMQIFVVTAAGTALYLGVNKLMGSKIQDEAIAYIRSRIFGK
ncbi:MAG: lipopolysaccharide biosynthesis protein [Firmicutes bacterium]|nr:lipopolysaccharide biosynthesis protein [Bacillota bacterium]MCM1401542.1 lipopolysaccharide biosynthesis protein [Bacteroides sp.]MCM1476588.1 lipopolysaccharide biosynthesis protein [Bacteroides sp.]